MAEILREQEAFATTARWTAVRFGFDGQIGVSNQVAFLVTLRTCPLHLVPTKGSDAPPIQCNPRFLGFVMRMAIARNVKIQSCRKVRMDECFQSRLELRPLHLLLPLISVQHATLSRKQGMKFLADFVPV